MRIGIDVMGGDNAPQAAIRGAFIASESLPSDVVQILIGDSVSIQKEIGEQKNNFEIVQAKTSISSGENPTRAFTQKSDSSIAIGFKLLKKGEIEAFVSCGNTGAILVGAVLSAKPLGGVLRPCIMSLIPQINGDYSLLLDVGSNADCKPESLYQFGILGSLYAKHVLNKENPKIGLVNIGEEAEKGNFVAQVTYQLMQSSKDINFIGNIEGRDLLNSKADVFVCDGFTGNVVLKLIESFYSIFKNKHLEDEYFEMLNYETYGGTPILGINSTVIVGHGISNDIAFSNMIKLAYEVENSSLNEKIKLVIQHDED